MEHILIIQLSRMGDVINTLPLIKSLKEEKENRHITLICYKECSGIIPTPDTSLIDRFVRINIGDIEELAGFDESGKTKGYHFPELTEQYDMVINLAYGEWPAVLCNKIKAKIKFGRIPSKEGEVRQLGDWMKYFFSFIHHRTYNLFNIADIFTRTAHLKNRHVTGYLPLQEADENKAGELLKAKGYQGKGSLIALQIGASKLFRAWELEKFAQLGKVLKKNRDVQVVIIGSKEEQSLADTFLSYADYPVINLVGATTITRLPGILKKCALLISNDTGPAHIASAVGTKVLGIYFASAYFAETGPYGDGNVVIQTQMPCLPC
ncbi:MAG: glycosyltransferase family 9 protein, partial [bacterium]|nr:glycosyltransferase family 9 protein [bacterium]